MPSSPNTLALALALAFALPLALALTPLACSRSDAHEPDDAIPQRIASRTVSSDEILWALGDEVRARVVGISPMADDPRYSGVAQRWPNSVPRLGRNPEELLATGAQLVILASFSDAEYRSAITDHAELLVLDDFSGFAAYLANLERVGEAVGASPESIAAVRERFETRRVAIESERPPLAARPSVVAWEAGHVPGASTTFDDIATCAGFRNLAREQGLVGHQRVDAEQLVAWDPAWIVIGCGEQACARAIEAFAEQPGFAHLQAVREAQVIAIEAPWLGSVGEGMLEAAARMKAARVEARP